jgi:hypothetical protein
MSKPIFFNGLQYKSKEAMPPEVRIVYEGLTEDRELAELAELEAQENGPDEGMPTAAEGEPLAPGAGPASAAALEAESSLGPASAVFERDGPRLVPSFGTPHASGLVLYRDGLAFQTGKDLHTWRWEEVAAIGSNLTRHDHQKPAA